MRLSLISAFSLLITIAATAQVIEFSTPTVITASDATTNNQRPRLTCDDAGTLHLIWATGNDHTGHIAYSVAMPDGLFGEATIASGDVQGWTLDAAGGPTIATKNEFVAVGWDAGSSNNRAIWATQRQPGSDNWSPPSRADAGNARIRYYTAVDIFPDGRVAQCWLNFSGGLSDPHMEWAVQDESGEFGEIIRPTDASDGLVCECCWPAQVVLDDGQTVLVAFRNNDANLREIHVVRSNDGGATFDEDYRVDTSGWMINGCPTTGPHIVADRDTVLVTFMSAADGTSRIYSARSIDGGATWEPMIELDANGAGGSRNYPQIAVRDSVAVVAWQEPNDEFLFEIRACYSLDGGGTWSEAVTISDNVERQDQFVTVAVTPAHDIEIVFRGTVQFSNPLLYRSRGVITEPNSTEPIAPVPSELSLTAYPNPFNSTLSIRYSLSHAPVSLRIFDTLGREVADFTSADLNAPGGELQWDASGVGAGIYFVKLESAEQSLSRKVIYLK